MPAKLKQYKAALKSLQEKHELNPIRQSQADITRIEARLYYKKKEKRVKAKDKRAKLSISITRSYIIDMKAKSQYPINRDNQPLADAYRKVDNTRRVADNAITDLRIIRSKDNISPEEINAIRKVVESTIIEANQLIITITLIDNNA